MKDFFEINSRSIVKLYVNQIAMSVFGIMVIMGLGRNDLLVFLTSLLSVVIYLVIIYSMMWEAGAKAAAKTLRAEDAGVQKIKTPFMIILFGSLLNILFYIIYTIMQIIISVNNITEGSAAFFGNLVYIIMRLINSIYMGFESLLFYNPNAITLEENTVLIMQTPAYYFFLTLIPLFAIGIIAYYLGASEINILRKLGFKTKNPRVSNTHIDYTKNKK